MSRLERRRRSLSARTFRMSVAGSLVLGLVAMLIGLGLYSYALAGQYIGAAFNLSRNAAGILGKVVDTGPLCDGVMQTYRGLSEEERARVGTAAYAARFEGVCMREDYLTARSLLRDFLDDSDADAIYIAMYDRDTSAMVYMVDPGEEAEGQCLPGDWESVNPKGLEKFMTWDGTGRLYDVGKTENYGWLCTSGVPLRDAGGRIFGFVLTDISLENVLRGIRRFFLQYVIAMFLAVNLIAMAVARRMRKQLVEPINRIAGAARDYVRDKREGAAVTDHFASLNIGTGDEVENLALVMSDMERDLSDHEENLKRVTAEKERIGIELSLATRIQADMLPNIFPAFPNRSEFDIYASMTPAKEVGGDFYDFFLIDDDLLAIVMADVSGKGVPAALFMMVSKILIKNYAMTLSGPGKVLDAVNRQICANNREDMFVTVWLGFLDLRTGKLTAANAGHEYPVLKRPGGSFAVFRDKHSFVIGSMSGITFREYELQLEPGAKLFLYTDGVPEATDAGGVLFGTDRMVGALQSAQDGTPAEILAAVDGAVRRFIGTAPQFDDLTMLCLHYSGKQTSEGGPHMKELTLDATLENIAAVTDFVNEELEQHNCSMKAQMQIDMAIDELFGNIARYAYSPGKGVATVRVAVEPDPETAVIVFIDRGMPYDPLTTAEPDITAPAEDRKIGGLGVFLVRKTMDGMHYEYKDGQNILCIRKRI